MEVLRKNGLTLVLMLMFLVSVGGQLLTGRKTYNQEAAHQGQPPIESVAEYARTPHFRSTLFENWESEFLQMAFFVFLTAFLVQKGSSESNPPPDEPREPVKYPKLRYFRGRPILRRLYENSLSLALFVLFLISFVLHAQGSWQRLADERAHEGLPPIRFAEVFSESEFWFESFQNWQSEFFSVAIMGLLSIYLRQKDSTESKEVDAPHQKTGR